MRTRSGALVASAAAILVVGAPGCANVQQSADQPATASPTSGDHNNNVLIAGNTQIQEFPVQLAFSYCTAPPAGGTTGVPTPLPSGSDCYSVSADQPWGGVTGCDQLSPQC